MNQKGTFKKSVKDGKRTYKVYGPDGQHIDTLSGVRDYYAITYKLYFCEETSAWEIAYGNPKVARQSFGREDLLRKAVAPTDNVLVCTEAVEVAKTGRINGYLVPMGAGGTQNDYTLYDENKNWLASLTSTKPAGVYAVAYIGGRTKEHRHLYSRPDLLEKALAEHSLRQDALVCVLRFAPFNPQPTDVFTYEGDLHDLTLYLKAHCPKNLVAGYIGAIRHDLSRDEVQMLMNGIRKMELEGRADRLPGTIAHDINGILDGDGLFDPRLSRFYKDPTGENRTPWPNRRLSMQFKHQYRDEQELADLRKLCHETGAVLSPAQGNNPYVTIFASVAVAMDSFGITEQQVHDYMTAEDDEEDGGDNNEFEADALANHEARNPSIHRQLSSGSPTIVGAPRPNGSTHASQDLLPPHHTTYTSLEDMQPDTLDPNDDIDPIKLRKQMHQSHLEANPT